MFSEPNILVCVGVESQKIMKRFSGEVSFIENQIYKETGSFETFRLLVNACTDENMLLIHGDLYFDANILCDAYFSRSFIVLDTSNNIADREVYAL